MHLRYLFRCFSVAQFFVTFSFNTSNSSRSFPICSSILILKSPEAFISMLLMLLILLKPLAALLQSEFMYLPCAYQNVAFNSRPCERGFELWNLSCSRIHISIHAPARGASLASRNSARHRRFQFTPLREGLHLAGHTSKYTKTISIHAPARGASRLPNLNLELLPYFYSRPCERGFASGDNSSCLSVEFQFTPLREGLQRAMPKRCGVFLISIHAPARGASGSSPRRSSYKTISIHAPARGASSTRMVFVRLCTDFNSRPCERGF